MFFFFIKKIHKLKKIIEEQKKNYEFLEKINLENEKNFENKQLKIQIFEMNNVLIGNVKTFKDLKTNNKKYEKKIKEIKNENKELKQENIEMEEIFIQEFNDIYNVFLNNYKILLLFFNKNIL